jgi:hypothetical protein
MSAVVPTKPPAVAFRNVFELAADYGISFRKIGAKGKEKDTMILYNTIVGLAAGAGLLGVAQLLKQFANGEKVQPEGFVLTCGITEFIQTVLGLTISVMWPYTRRSLLPTRSKNHNQQRLIP